MGDARFWLTWSMRDARRRWMQIVATALVLAIGAGTFAGLAGTTIWRERSNDRSYARLNGHDLRFDLAEGSHARPGQLSAALADLRARGLVRAAEERLIVPTQVDASGDGRTVLVRGRLVGIPPAGDGPRIDRLAATGGRTLRGDDAARSVAVLDAGFAREHGLAPSGTIRLAGLGPVSYVGVGLSPQYFVIAQQGVTGGQRSFAVVYVPLALAQRSAGQASVNELLVDVPPGASVARAERAVRSALRAALPGVGVVATRFDEEDAHRILYRDARNDRRLFMVFAVLVLASAAFAAFNLIARVVEAQRREIGIGMALGVPPRLLALRPLLLGAQIGVLGALLGAGATFALSAWLTGAVKELLPLPAYAPSFQLGLFLVGAAVALTLPLLAAALPVRRGVRVAPIEAIRTGFRASKGSGMAPLLRRLPVPGGSLAQMPARNLARNPRRTALTVLGLAGAVVAVVGILGMVDSLQGAVTRLSGETLRRSPDRVVVALDGIQPASSRAVHSVAADPSVGQAEASLIVPGRLRAGPAAVDASLAFTDPRSPIWTPHVEAGRFGPLGVTIARRAADDLGVWLGDMLAVQHPRRTAAGFDLVETRLAVTGIHASPLRPIVYLPARQATALGLGGLVNAVTATPAPGRSSEDVVRALFGRPGVASVEPVAAGTEGLERTIDAFLGAIRITVLITLGLALLIAFNSTSVAIDERLREYATMFAFGLRPRDALRLAVAEGVVAGLLATLLGIAGGLALTGWVVNELLPDTFPDLGAVTTLAGGSLVLAAAIGIGAVAVAPLLTLRRLRRMDVPATLRVVE